MRESIKDLVIQLAEPLVRDCGLEIWGLDISGQGTQTVRLFVDVPATPARLESASNPENCHHASATINQCEEISRRLALALEVEDCFPGPWVMEVSSPGLERKFYTLEQLRPYLGDMIEANLLTPLEGTESRKTYRGRLVAVGESSFELYPCSLGEDGRILPESIPQVRIPWAGIRRVSRIHIFNPGPRPGKGPKKRMPKAAEATSSNDFRLVGRKSERLAEES